MSVEIHVCDRARQLVMISDIEIFVPCCSAHFAVHNGAVQFAIEYIYRPKLCEFKYEHLRILAEKGANLLKGVIYNVSVYYVCSHSDVTHTSHKI